MASFDAIADLPIEIESYELEDRDRTYGDFTRPSTIIHLHGAGEEGIGEDVLYDVLERDPQPVRFVCSTRLSTFGEDDSRSSTDAVRKRLAKYPTLRFKLDPKNDWDDGLIEELQEIADVD